MKRRVRFMKKRHGWLVMITFLVWLLITLMVVFVDPENVRDFILTGSYVLPGILIFAGGYLVLSILTLSSKKALLWASLTLIFLYLRLWGMGNYLNLILLLGFGVSVELYWRQN